MSETKEQEQGPVRFRVTNRERLGLAMMFSSAWGGQGMSEDILNDFYDAYEALGIENVRNFVVQTQQGMNVALPKGQEDELSDTKGFEATIPRDALALVLDSYPAQPTPAMLGPAKVRFLRKARALVPRKELPQDSKEKIPAPPRPSKPPKLESVPEETATDLDGKVVPIKPAETPTDDPAPEPSTD